MDTKTTTANAKSETPAAADAVTTYEAKAIEMSDADLESVSGGFLDNLAAKCEIQGGLNLLSSNVAIELG